MRAWMAGAALLGLAAGLSLAGCKHKDPNAIEPAAFDAIATEVADELNAPDADLFKVLRSADDKVQIGWDALTLNLDGEDEPVGWWFQNKGWISLSGLQFISRPVFIVTDAGKDVLATTDLDWFNARPGPDKPQVDCGTAEAMAVKGCAVSMTVIPAISQAGSAIVTAKDMAPIKLHAVVFSGDDGWQVATLTPEGGALNDVSIDATLGPKQVRATQIAGADEALMARVKALQQPTQVEVKAQAAAALPRYEPPPPVAPVPQVDLKTELGLSRGLPTR